jgi:hypothetical protein
MSGDSTDARRVDAPTIDEFRRALSKQGWRVTAHPGFGFGSWLIEIEWGLRVSYNGKDGMLRVEREKSRDNWVKVWAAHERHEQTPAALIAVLRGETG